MCCNIGRSLHEIDSFSPRKMPRNTRLDILTNSIDDERTRCKGVNCSRARAATIVVSLKGYLDSVAGLALIPFIIKEAREAIHGGVRMLSRPNLNIPDK